MIGRIPELNMLNEAYDKNASSILVLYGREGQGKTTLLQEFVKDKPALWFECLPGSVAEIKKSFIKAMGCQLQSEIQVDSGTDFLDIVAAVEHVADSERLVLIVKEFQHMVKASKEFTNDLVKALSRLSSKLTIVLSSSSVYFVENGLVSAMGTAAMYISSFVKLKEFSFVETVRMFPEYNVEEIVRLYAITGGVPGYLARFEGTDSVEQNVKRLFIAENGILAKEGHEFIKNELRETGVYNTILSALATGRNKLNEIHDYTGYGRDKISVYIKNLTEREIVEKVFSYDSDGYENTKKGLYRIKDNMVNFWYRFIYQNNTALSFLGPNEFYGRYIADFMSDFASETFTKVALEYLELMNSSNQLPFKVVKKGSWYGKSGDISIICESEKGEYIIGQTNSTDQMVGIEGYEHLLDNARLAGIDAKYVFIFSLGGFAFELKKKALEDSAITLIGMEDL